MGKYTNLADDIITNVGGKENIKSLTHCITRLRFVLKDESKAKGDVIKNLDGVVTAMSSGGQYQVVIGNEVIGVYEEVCIQIGIENKDADDDNDSPGDKKGFIGNLMDIINKCFAPILGPLCACGIIKGLSALLLFIIGPSFAASGTYIVLNGIGDTVFYFMPVLLGYTAAKRFRVDPVVGLVIGGLLCYPAIQAAALSAGGASLGTVPFVGEYYTTFLGVPLVAQTYTSTVIPVLVIVAFAGRIQKLARKILPEIMHGFFVPFFVLLISIPVGLQVIGPVVNLLASLAGRGFEALNAANPIIFGIISGLLWEILIIFGIHWSLTPIAMMNFQTLGYDY